MSIAFYLVMVLVVGAPALAFLDGPAIWGGLAIASSVSLAVILFRMQPGEAAHFARIARPALLLATIPVMWIAAQLVPGVPLAHPIWQSTGAALGEATPGRISVDPGATLLALGHFVTAMGICFATMALTIDRRRAELCLLVLTVTAGVTALTIMVHDVGGFTFLGELGRAVRASYDGAAAVGVVLALATADLAVERFETRRQAGTTWARLVERLALALQVFVVCVAAVVYFQADAVSIASLTGAVAFGLVVVVRRSDIGRWVGLAVATIVTFAFVMALAGPGRVGNSDLALHFSTNSTQVIARMLEDAPWAGTGAGTFASMNGLYRDTAGLSSAAPTTAAILSIEFGRPFFWLAGILALSLAGLLVRSALVRGRDSFYSAVAGGCVLVLLLQALRDASLFGPTMAVLASAIVGLGLAQSVGRRLERS